MLEHGPPGSLPPKRTGSAPGPGVRSPRMVEETEATEATETQKPGDAPAVEADAPTAEEAGPLLLDPNPEDGEQEVNTALLADLPAPAFHRIIALPVGGNVAAVENSKRSLMFVRGAPQLYAVGVIKKTKATDLPGELKALVELCGEGRGGDVFSLADLLAARKRAFN